MIRRCLIVLLISSLLAHPRYGKEQLNSNSLYPGDMGMWNHIMDSGPPIALRDTPCGVILPHHAIVTREMARCYQGIAQHINPTRIIIIGPDHYETGTGPIVTTDSMRFPTVYGDLETDVMLTEKMLKDGLATSDNRVFVKEHAVYTHAPFIRHFFPNARIVPVLIRWGTSKNALDDLASWISQNMNEDTLVLASVDFSHYQPRPIADFHDARSFRAIRGFRFDEISHCEIDSPASVYTLMRIMQSKGYGTAERMLHTNSDDLLGRKEAETTSHQYLAFLKGAPAQTGGLSVLVTGNVNSADSAILTRTNWEWDRRYDRDHDATPNRYLRNIRGIEDRFFIGADMVLMDLPTSVNEEMYTAGTNRIRVIRISPRGVVPPGDLIRVRERRKDADYLFILYHRAEGVFSEADSANCRTLIDSGADLVIVRGLSVVQPSERYRGGVIFPSCGDFIVPGITAESEVHGVDFDGESISIYTQGITMENGYPRIRMK